MSSLWQVILQEKEGPHQMLRREYLQLRRTLRNIARPSEGEAPVLLSAGLAYGDALILKPAIHDLHEKFPDSPIHLLVNNSRISNMYLYDTSVSVIISGPQKDPKTVDFIKRNYMRQCDFGGWITSDPESFWMNNYEIPFKKLHLKPGKISPAFPYSEEEDLAVRNALASVGIDTNSDRIVLIHVQSSAMMRAWPVESALSLARNLIASRQVKVIIAGTKKMFKEGEEIPEIPNIFFSFREFGELKLREAFLLTKYASVVVAVDSVYAHVTAAFEKPCVLLYGAFRPELLAAPHCKHAYVFQHDMPCGPCHQHHGRCIQDPKGSASPCMRAITVEEVQEAAEKLLDGVMPKTRVRMVKEFRGVTEPCPVCGCPSSDVMARKRDIFYARCAMCSTIFRPYDTERDGDGLFATDEPGMEFASLNELMQPPQVAIDHLCATAGTLLDKSLDRTGLILGAAQNFGIFKSLRKKGWNCEIYDPDCEDSGPEPLWATGIQAGRSLSPAQPEECSHSAAFVLGGMTRIPRMDRLWRLLTRKVVPNGQVALLAPLADYNNWKEAQFLNTRLAGWNIVVPSLKGLEEGGDRHGFVLEYSSRVGISSWQGMIWRREVEGAEINAR
jgi:ADP-heptose:LPS heptosyltransferase